MPSTREIAASRVNWNDLVLKSAMEENERLRAALKECSDDLAREIESRYAGMKDHPAMKRRFDRDMYPARNARKLLALEQKADGK